MPDCARVFSNRVGFGFYGGFGYNNIQILRSGFWDVMKSAGLDLRESRIRYGSCAVSRSTITQVIVIITKYVYLRKLVYGKIVVKW